MRSTYECLVLAIPLALALVAGQAEAQTTPRPDATRLREWFQSVDRNGDARIDREEFHQWAVERFFFLDKDRKGHLVPEELRSAVGPEAFKIANRKGDGKLTLQEFVHAVFQDFDAANLNKDGVLTFEEVEAYVRRTRP